MSRQELCYVITLLEAETLQLVRLEKHACTATGELPHEARKAAAAIALRLANYLAAKHGQWWSQEKNPHE